MKPKLKWFGQISKKDLTYHLYQWDLVDSNFIYSSSPFGSLGNLTTIEWMYSGLPVFLLSTPFLHRSLQLRFTSRTSLFFSISLLWDQVNHSTLSGIDITSAIPVSRLFYCQNVLCPLNRMVEFISGSLSLTPFLNDLPDLTKVWPTQQDRVVLRI